MNRDYSITLATAEQAAEWLERLPDASPEEREAFLAWIRTSPVHVRELLLAVRCAELLATLDPQRQIDVRALISPAGKYVSLLRLDEQVGELASVHRLGSARSGGRLRRTTWKAAAVLAIVAVFSVLTMAIHAISERTVATRAGEWRTTQLADGTLLRTGPRTKLTIDFSDRHRTIHLIRGEVLADVAQDPARPFVVQTTLAAARAVGTTFAVRRVAADRVVVTVKEGVVSVTRRLPSSVDRLGARITAAKAPKVQLKAGEQVGVAAAQPLIIQTVDLRKELSWADGRLTFYGQPISEAVRDINLRSRKQLRVLDAQFAQRPIYGIFDAADADAFASVLASLSGGSVVNEGQDTILLLPRGDDEESDSGA